MTAAESRLLAPWALSALNPRRTFPSIEKGQQGASVEAWRWIAEQDGLYILTNEAARSGLVGQIWVRWWLSADGLQCHVGLVSVRPIEDVEQLARWVVKGHERVAAKFTIERRP